MSTLEIINEPFVCTFIYKTVRSNTNMTGPESVDLISEIYLNHYRNAILNFKNDIFGNLIARSLNLSHKINGTMHFKILLSKDNGSNTVAWWGGVEI